MNDTASIKRTNRNCVVKILCGPQKIMSKCAMLVYSKISRTGKKHKRRLCQNLCILIRIFI